MSTQRPGPITRLLMNRRGYSLAWQRAAFELMLGSLRPPKRTRIEMVYAGGVPAAWITPPNAKTGRILYYLHGGGYMMGSIRSHSGFAARLADASGARALLIEYRRAPEDPFPAALEDAGKGYRWLLEQSGGDDRIIAAGESAGAGLTLATMLALKDQCELPIACFVLSPWADLANSDKSLSMQYKGDRSVVDFNLAYMAEMYADGEDLRNPLISPVYADLSGLPPLVIHAGKDEPVRQDAVKLAEHARAAGVEVTFEQYDGKVHALHSLAHLSRQASEWLEKAGALLERQFG